MANGPLDSSTEFQQNPTYHNIQTVMLSSNLRRSFNISRQISGRQCVQVQPATACHSVRRLATTAPPDGPPISETNRAETTMKRFWKTASVEQRGDELTVTLDGRPLRTPSGNVLLVPASKLLLATMVATEWENQERLLKPHSLPLTSIVCRAIDGFAGETAIAQIRARLLEYIDTDTVCFHQDEPPQLVELQDKHWKPLLDWTRSVFDIEVHTSESVLFHSQPEATRQKVDHFLSGLDRWQLAAVERVSHTTKSLIIALAVVKKYLTVEDAALATQVEVASQIQRWGEVEDGHDVDHHDVRRQIGSAALLLADR